MNRKSEHVKTGVTAFLTVGAILLFYDTLFGHHWLLNVWRQLMTAVRPILYGAFMAYLLAPVVNFFEDRLFSAQVRKARERGRFTAPAVRAASRHIFLTVEGHGSVAAFAGCHRNGYLVNK